MDTGVNIWKPGNLLDSRVSSLKLQFQHIYSGIIATAYDFPETFPPWPMTSMECPRSIVSQIQARQPGQDGAGRAEQLIQRKDQK